MKYKFLVLSAMMIVALSGCASDINLPQPQKNGGMSLMEALSKRKSTREFDSEKD